MFFIKKVNKLNDINDLKKDKELNLFNNLKIEEIIFSINNNLLKKYLEKIMNFKENYLRTKAEIENIKKRSNDDINKTYKYAIEEFSENLLNVLDSLEAALYNKSNEIEKLMEGIRLTLQLLINILKKNNIITINPEIGSKFDPYKHLAISKINEGKEDDTINTVLQKGYTISDRLLRPALVVVNKV